MPGPGFGIATVVELGVGWIPILVILILGGFLGQLVEGGVELCGAEKDVRLMVEKRGECKSM